MRKQPNRNINLCTKSLARGEVGDAGEVIGLIEPQKGASLLTIGEVIMV